MKNIKFRPLRRIKKTGKITVASYMQWRKVKTADYNKFHLVINDEYKSFNSDELVYDHEGELLFWHIKSPESIPVIDLRGIPDFDDYMDAVEKVRQQHKNYITHNREGKYGGAWSSYHIMGTDCDGVPCFSHKSADKIADGYSLIENIAEFEPLTVGVVVKWFGWFLYNLENSNLCYRQK